MLETLIFTVAHYALSMLFFMGLQKPLFILYNKNVNKKKPEKGDMKKVFRLGGRTDRIAASYLTGLPVVMLLVLSFVPGADVRTPLLVLEAVLAAAVAPATVSDTALYRFWQFKLEASVLTYLRHPKGAFASVSPLFVAAGVLAVVLVACIYFALMWAVSLLLDGFAPAGWNNWLWHLGYVLMMLVVSACIFADIRGINIRPNNPTMVCFSPNLFLNHCALNPLYNFIYSFSVKDSYKRDFRFFDTKQCAKDFEGLYPTEGTPQVELLKTKRPNILLIVWESLSARYISNLGGQAGVMPNFERLSEEGVYFTRCDCGSFRTERGLVCVLDGIPGQPTDTLAKHSGKLPNMPAIPHNLKAEGYETMALHAGNCLIMHKSELYLSTGHDTLVQQKDLPDLGNLTRWGYHDGGDRKSVV